MVCGLEFFSWLGEEESAPVGDAAHDAALVEDDFAGGFGDSGNIWSESKICRRQKVLI